MIAFCVSVINLEKDGIVKGNKLDKSKAGEWETLCFRFDVIIGIDWRTQTLAGGYDVTVAKKHHDILLLKMKHLFKKFWEVEGGKMVCPNVRSTEGISYSKYLSVWPNN